MLVDDPVKRVDNMTMAHGLEARTPFLDHELVELAARCPPELKLADGGKGVLKRAARGLVPDAVIDRPKGYFPVPALSHLEGAVLELVRDALRSPAARERGLFRPDVVEAMLSAPNEHRTNLDGSTLWQLGLLELWLQEHAGAACGRAARDFADWYGSQPEMLRAHVDGVLDDLGRWWDGSYAALTWSAGGPDAARSATVASALGLAERTTEPPPLDEDDRSVTSALVA